MVRTTDPTAIKSLAQLCYCQSGRHARAAVKALQAAGYAARTDAIGDIYCDTCTEATRSIADAAIKALK